MENKNMIIRFCGCKPSKKTILNLIKIFTVSYKKRKASGLTPKCTERYIQMVNKLWQKLSEYQKNTM